MRTDELRAILKKRDYRGWRILDTTYDREGVTTATKRFKNGVLVTLRSASNAKLAEVIFEVEMADWRTSGPKRLPP